MSLATGSNYLLPQDRAEMVRLQRQHQMFRILQGREERLLPSCLADFNFSKVLDAAAGTCVWVLDFASEVKERLRPDSQDRLEIYACDITSAKFPTKEIADAIPLTMFEQDLTKAFQPQFHKSFDLVNMKLLVLALTEDGWTSALENVRKVLKPGGFLLLSESDGFFRLPGETSATGVISSNGIQPWTFYLNRLFSENAKKSGHITNLAVRLSDLVSASGYEIYSQTTTTFPMGILCQTRPGLLGQSVAAAQDLSAEQFLFVLDIMTKLGLQHQCLEDENGAVIDEEGRLAMVKRYTDSFLQSGVLFSCTEIVAKKPL
ncbi:hypothetical protein C8J56DRAFT_914324 [Mycena floridula]|nr:hypothetical protein C8J56DRAFT_914324 [Mycena floridula]